MRKTLTTLALAVALITTQALAAPAAPHGLTTTGSILVAADEKAKPQTSKATPATPATPAVPGTAGTPAKPATPATPAIPNGGGPGSNPGNGSHGKASRS
ncbi:hypothetical protein KRX52_09220 [Pseudomonas sp. MAP12]|uniref:Proteophosphoglycan ppg4 n=1 Tax=Geopseudomonas aromaticivorans TaxID=2849492 RepID=A0ABS6MW10_9GAMM|nr:hypothetical protein [Pseudomonas aromaticivorans]MBV2132981.1 hypothetical protein [Pseudomonas aromaticivorans]